MVNGRIFKTYSVSPRSSVGFAFVVLGIESRAT